jgi:hypothetical protein
VNLQTRFCFSKSTILDDRVGLDLSVHSSRAELEIEDEPQPFVSLPCLLNERPHNFWMLLLFSPFMQSLTWIHTHVCEGVQANKALLVASEMGQVEKVRQLTTANADVEARDEVTDKSMHTRNAHLHT